jgi:hypothetical protein
MLRFPLRLRSLQQRKLSKLTLPKMLQSKEGKEDSEEEVKEGKFPNLYNLDRPKDVVSGVTDVTWKYMYSNLI